MDQHLQHLLESNEPPTELEAAEIRDIISQTEASLLYIGNALPIGRQQMSLRANAYRAVLSPLRRVPFEILRQIFFLVYPRGLLNPEPLPAILLLCSICRKWREIALKIPQLWADIRMLPTPRGVGKMSCVYLTELCLQRSQSIPISITFNNELGDNPTATNIIMGAMLDVAMRHAARWAGFTWRNEPSSDVLSSYPACHFPLLRSLDLSVHLEESPKFLQWIRSLLRHTPQLHSLTITGIEDNFDMFPWHQLTTVRIRADLSMQDYVFILSQCRQIEIFHMDTVCDVQATLPPLQIPVLTSNRLLWLVIRSSVPLMELFAVLVCPALQGLHIHEDDGNGTWSKESFSSFVTRSSFRLTSFTISGNWLMEEEDAIQCLHDVSSQLTRLSFQVEDVLKDTAMGLLTVQQTASDDEADDGRVYCLGPHLKYISLGLSLDLSRDGMFADMVESRFYHDPSRPLPVGVTPLRFVGVILSTMRNVLDTMRLRTMERDGLELDLDLY